MRSRQGTSNPEPLRMRAFRLETTSPSEQSSARSTEHSQTMTSPRLGATGHPSTPTKQPTGNSTTSPATLRSPSESHDTPSKYSIDVNGRATSPKITDSDTFTQLSPDNTTNGDAGGAWSSAVGGATVGGKSGRVIERLMAQVDNLTRELRLASAKLEEEQRRSELARAALESLRGSNENLETICETSKAGLVRRDRKIEDLKGDLAIERSRREVAESEKSHIAKESEETVIKYQQELDRERERADNASTQYETLKYSFKHMKEGYQRHLTHLYDDIGSVRKRMDSDQEKFSSLEIVCLELRSEHEKVHHSSRETRKQFEKYKESSAASLQSIVERAERDELANEAALKELNKTMGEMRYVMNVKRNAPSLLRQEESDHGPTDP